MWVDAIPRMLGRMAPGHAKARAHTHRGVHMPLLRQLLRRKLRTTLTIVGITVGIWALVVMGSMANKINTLVSGASGAYAGRVAVTDASNSTIGLSISPMRLDVVDQVRAVDGVAAAEPQIQMIYDPDASASFAVSDTLLGRLADAERPPDAVPTAAAEGRLLDAGDEGTMLVVFGHALADKVRAHLGATITIRGFTFTVVGILEPTLSIPDYIAYVPLSAAQRLLSASLPAPIRAAIPETDLASQVMAYPADGVTVEQLAERIEARVEDVATVTQADYDQQLGSSVTLINSILIGVALISLVVGGLSVINTMAMSVAERTREIGVKRAIGGTRGQIIRELVGESAVIGLIGGLLGVALGSVVVAVANEAGRSSGTLLFTFSPVIALFAVLFSTVLGMLAGFVPAWGAARLDPVQALRYE
jgi:putative ABC transport system permease protein